MLTQGNSLTSLFDITLFNGLLVYLVLIFWSIECHNYATLYKAHRKVTYTYNHHYCDNSIGPGWFRFDGAAGKRMASSCPPIDRCGTSATGWLTGGHPSVADGQVSRNVCFHHLGNRCYYSTKIQVINCASYYVYYLIGTPACSLRYCGSG